MEPVVQERRGRRLMGLALSGEDVAPYILQLWVKLSARLHSVPGQVEPHILYGVWRKETTGSKTELAYLVGVETTSAGPAPRGLEAWDIYPADCAVFVPRGDMGRIVGTYGQIANWFKTAPRGPALNGYVLEVYDTTQNIDDSYAVEIWEELA